jgi:hypothetical protein
MRNVILALLAAACFVLGCGRRAQSQKAGPRPRAGHKTRAGSPAPARAVCPSATRARPPVLLETLMSGAGQYSYSNF